MIATLDREEVFSIEEVQNEVCIRRWKRDGSVNRMGMQAAVDNLDHNSPKERQVRSRLFHGEVIETKLAEFYLA